MESKQFKLVLVGDARVGKTTYVKWMRTGVLEEKYVPTLGVEVHPIRFASTKGDIVFNIWDTAGQDKLKGLVDGYYIKSDCCITMYDTTREETITKRDKLVADVHRVCGDIPILYFEATNVDREELTNFSRGMFLELARTLTNDQSLLFL